MSLPYYSNTTTWEGVQPIDAWVEFPFEEENDLVTKEYKITCNCRNSHYEVPDYSDTMASAATAKLNQLPFTADNTAYFLGDSNFSSGEADTTTFTRTFGAVPQTRTLSEQSYNYTFPEKRSWWRNSSTSATTTTHFLANWNNDIPPLLERTAITENTAAKFTYTYQYRTDKGLGFSPSELFSIKQNSLTTGSFSAGGITYYPYVPETLDCGYLCDTLPSYIGGVSWPNTDPYLGLYEYRIQYQSPYYLMAESIVKHYKGNIFYRRDIEVEAK